MATDEQKNSLLTDRIDGLAYQILSDDQAVYEVRLGRANDYASRMRAVEDAADAAGDWKARRFPREKIELVHVVRGPQRSEITLGCDGEEVTWRMSVRIPDEAIERVFGGLDVVTDEESDPDRSGLPPAPGPTLIGNLSLCALSLIVTAVWWVKPSPVILVLSLLIFPACVVHMALAARRDSGRPRWWMLAWLMPGLSLLFVHARVNYTDNGPLIKWCLAVTFLLAALYVLIARGHARRGCAALIALVTLLTYAPGATRALNGFGSEVVIEQQAIPMIIRSEAVELQFRAGAAPLWFAARPEVTRQLRIGYPCLVRTRRGLLGVTYETVEPYRTDQVA